MRHVALAVAITVAFLGCKEQEPEKKGSGVKDCDDYIAALEACVAKLPDEAKKPMRDTLDAQRSALQSAKGSAKTQLRDGCRTGLATLKQNPACK